MAGTKATGRRALLGNGYWLFLLATGVAMLLLNLLDAPTLSDDMLYRFKWSADEQAAPETIETLGDLLSSQGVHYLCVNGRLPVHLLAQACLVFVPPVVVQTANSVLFVLLVHLIVSLTAHSRHSLFVAVTACCLLLLVMQGVRTTLLWSLGAFNYLWVAVATLCLLVGLQRCAGGAAWRCGWGWLLLPLAFVAGWGHEALSLPLSVAFATLLLSGRTWRLGVAPLLLAYMAGCCLLLLSPALWGRAGDAVSMQGRLMSGAINLVFNVRVLWLLLAALLWLWWRRRAMLADHLRHFRPAYLALAVAVGIVVFCGSNLERVAFYTDFIALLLLLHLLDRQVSFGWQRRLLCAGIVLLAVAFFPIRQVRKDNYDRWLLAERQMEEPGRQLIAVTLPERNMGWLTDYLRNHYVNPSVDFGFYCSYMGFNATDINMRCAARLYGKERMVFMPDDVVRRAETDSLAYSDFELDAHGLLYVRRTSHPAAPAQVLFLLNDEDPSALSPLQRLVAYRDSVYELDNFNYDVVAIGGRHYVVLTKPTTNIYRRIREIKLIDN